VKKTCKIILFEEHPFVNFYTVQFVNEETSETEKFFNNYPDGCKYDQDIDVIISWLDKIADKGALERHFRPEGKMQDGVGAIPIYGTSTKLRLYCLRISDNILIIGNGGIKKTGTYNEDVHLNDCVSLLSGLDKLIKSGIRKDNITVNGKKISGNLTFQTEL